MIILDKFEFLTDETELAIAVDIAPVEVEKLVWDTKNTIILTTADQQKYALINILPDIRKMLARLNEIMVIFKSGDNIKEAFEVELIKDDSLNFEDNLHDEAVETYNEFEKLKKNTVF